VFIEQCQADGGPKPGSEKLRRLGVPDRASENKRGLGGGRYRRAQQQYQHSSWINSKCSGVRCQELPTTDTLPNRPLYGLSTSMGVAQDGKLSAQSARNSSGGYSCEFTAIRLHCDHSTLRPACSGLLHNGLNK